MPTIVSSYVQTLAGSVDARTRDSLTWSFTAIPQSMSVYVRFQERGTIHISGGRILQIGNTSDSSPRFIVLQAGGLYRAQFQTASVTRTSTLAAAPVVGQFVELLATISRTGSVQISQSINNATVTAATASAATLFPPAWAGTTLTVNGNGVAADDGAIALLNIVIVRGVHDMTAMRRYAATKP